MGPSRTLEPRMLSGAVVATWACWATLGCLSWQAPRFKATCGEPGTDETSWSHWSCLGSLVAARVSWGMDFQEPSGSPVLPELPQAWEPPETTKTTGFRVSRRSQHVGIWYCGCCLGPWSLWTLGLAGGLDSWKPTGNLVSWMPPGASRSQGYLRAWICGNPLGPWCHWESSGAMRAVCFSFQFCLCLLPTFRSPCPEAPIGPWSPEALTSSSAYHCFQQPPT